MTASGDRELFTEQERGILATYRVARSSDWELGRVALLVVDVVESFVGRDVPVAEAQRECVTACGQEAWRAIEHISPMLEAFRAAGAPVAFSTIESLPAAAGASRRAPTSLRSDRVVDALAPQDGEYVMPKTKPSAFFGTPLTTWLTTRQVQQVVLVGGATSGCVRATALDAYSYGFDVLMPADGCFDRVETSHRVTLTDIDTKYGRVVRCADVTERLAARR
jgi:nicotinamidase-related amidase